MSTQKKSKIWQECSLEEQVVIALSLHIPVSVTVEIGDPRFANERMKQLLTHRTPHRKLRNSTSLEVTAYNLPQVKALVKRGIIPSFGW